MKNVIDNATTLIEWMTAVEQYILDTIGDEWEYFEELDRLYCESTIAQLVYGYTE